MPAPTHEDAMVMLKLMELANTPDMDKAGRLIWSDDTVLDFKAFKEKYPISSEQYGQVTGYLAWFETLATLWKQHLFNETLLYDWIMVRPIWTRLERLVAGIRQDRGMPRYCENFEALAAAEK